MAISPFRFPSLSLSLSRSPSTTTTTNLAYSRSTNLPYSQSTTSLLPYSHSTTSLLPYSRPTSALFHSSSSSQTNRPVRCRVSTSEDDEDDDDDEIEKDTLEMYRAFLERMFGNSSSDQLELFILKLVRSMAVRLVGGALEEKFRNVRFVDPKRMEVIEKKLDAQVDRLFQRLLKKCQEKKKKDENEDK